MESTRFDKMAITLAKKGNFRAQNSLFLDWHNCPLSDNHSINLNYDLWFTAKWKQLKKSGYVPEVSIFYIINYVYIKIYMTWKSE